MTLHDDLTRTAALLTAGWPITNLSRAKRAQEQQTMLTADQRADARADIARIDRASEDRDADEFVRAAETLAATARGGDVTIRVHCNRIAAALARIDGAVVSHFPPAADGWQFWVVKHAGVVAFSTVEVSK